MNIMTKYFIAGAVVLSGFSWHTIIYAGEPTDSIRIEQQLHEVVVSETRERQKGDHVELLLSDANRTYGTNALDAISSLSRFQTSLNAQSLTAWDQSEVFILINGIPSTPIELKSYKGVDIRKVEYYQTAPPKYMTYTKGTIINVIIKRRHDRQYSGYIDASNAVNTAFGDNQIDLTYADSLNQVKAGYYLSYRNIGHIVNHREFNYSPTLQTRYDDTKRFKGEYHFWNASYQRYQGNHLFNARIQYLADPGSEPTIGTGTIIDNNVAHSGISSSNTKSRVNTGILDLYYNYKFGSNREIAINIVNTYTSSHSDSYRTLSFEKPYDDLDYYVSSSVRNHTYSLIANAQYTSPLFGGRFQAGAKYKFNRIVQRFADERYTPSSHDLFFSTGIYWVKNGFVLFPAIGADMVCQSGNPESSYTSVKPFVQINTQWNPCNILKGFSTQLTLAVMNLPPSLSSMANSYTYTDAWMINIGNSNLKHYWHSYANLSISYHNHRNQNMIALKIVPAYYHNGPNPIISQHGKYIVRQSVNGNNHLNNTVFLTGSWHLFPWMEISPYMELITYRYDTPNQTIHKNYLRAGGQIAITSGKWAIILAANSPTKEYIGDFLRRGSAQYRAIVQYKYRRWSFGADYSFFSMNEYIKANVGYFSYMDHTDRKQLRYLSRLTATYSFSVGRARRHAQKILQNSSSETGLNDFQKAHQ